MLRLLVVLLVANLVFSQNSSSTVPADTGKDSTTIGAALTDVDVDVQDFHTGRPDTGDSDGDEGNSTTTDKTEDTTIDEMTTEAVNATEVDLGNATTTEESEPTSEPVSSAYTLASLSATSLCLLSLLVSS